MLSQIKQSEWDYASPTFYYGLDHGNTGNPVLNASSTALDVLQNSANAFHDFAPAIHQDYRNTHLFGKPVINYEGGQHFTNFTQPPYLQAMYDAQVLPQMYNLYDNVLDSIRLWGSKMAMAFTLASAKESIYGSWGHLEEIDQDTATLPAPKFQALIDNMAHTPIPIIGGDILSGNNIDVAYFHAQSPTGVGYSYSWSLSNKGMILTFPNTSAINVMWGPSTFIDTGWVSLTVTDNNGCSATTTVHLPIYLVMGVDGTANNFFSIYPNPAADNFFIVQKTPIPSQEKAYLLDIMGKIVREISLTGEKTEVNVTKLYHQGFMYLKLRIWSRRIVVE